MTTQTQPETVEQAIARLKANLRTLDGLPDVEKRAGFERFARDMIEAGKEVGRHPVEAMVPLTLLGMTVDLPRRVLVDTISSAIKDACRPTPDTAPDTVVTSSPPPPGVDLADGPDSTSVVVIDNEVS